MNSLRTKLRQRRNTIAFETAVRNASPSMRQELLAAAARSGVRWP